MAETIRAALDVALDAHQGSNVAFENAEYAPTRGTGYLRPVFTQDETEQAELGTSGRNRETGLYVINVYEPAGAGVGPAETVVIGLLAAFKRGETFTSGSVTVRVEKVWRSPGVQEGDWYRVPVSVRWFAYTAN